MQARSGLSGLFGAAAAMSVVLAPMVPVGRTERAYAETLALAPVESLTFAMAEPSPPGTHVVEQGDTLWGIATDAGVDVATLLQWNGLTEGDLLQIGQTLKLSGSAGSAAAAGGSAASAPSARAAAPRSYTVAEGDTLWSVAQQLETSTAALVEANQLDEPDRLKVGATLVVPTASGGSGSAAAARSAAPSSAATASSASSAGAAHANSAQASPSDTSSVASTPSPASASRPTRAASGGRSLVVPYTVQPGETLGQIARQFGVTADEIGKSSGLEDLNRIGVGAIVKVPLQGYEHVVSAGETLRDIAAQERVDLGSLIDFNELDDPELIRVGQVILVPAVAPGLQAANMVAAPAAAPSAVAGANSPPPAPAASAPAAAAAASAPPAVAKPSASAAASTPSGGTSAASASTASGGSGSGGASTSSGSGAPTGSASTGAPGSGGTAGATAASGGPAASGGAAASGGTAASGGAAAAAKPVAAAKPGDAATAKPGTGAAAKPVRVVQPPAGAPTDGIAGAALKFLGAPYVWGGSSPSGFDCSGFVWYAARQAGKSVGRGMLGEYNSGAHPSRDDLKPGDLVFFQNTYSPGLSHNGIYIGGGQFVHAADEAAGVTISSLNAAYWSSHWFGATRLP